MEDTVNLERLAKKMKHAKQCADYNRKRYWDLRRKVIAYLGEGCKHCGDFDPTHLEIHHIHPLDNSVKENGRRPGSRSGESRIKEWRSILAGTLEARLVCTRCHVEEEHGGNTHISRRRS